MTSVYQGVHSRRTSGFCPSVLSSVACLALVVVAGVVDTVGMVGKAGTAVAALDVAAALYGI